MPTSHPVPTRRPRSARRLSRTVAAATGAAAGVVLLAAPALAHVSVSSTSAVQGEYGVLTFHVPDESDKPTTSVQIVLPADQPLALVDVKVHPGWSWATTTAAPPAGLEDDDGAVDSVVTAVTWTATDGGIAPGAYDDFDLSVGPLPKAQSMQFKVLQTYADGTVVRWIQDPLPGGGEPDAPAPVLTLTAADAAAATKVGAESTTTTSTAAAAPTSTSTGGGNGLAITGIVVGAVAAVLALAALLRGGRRTTA